MPAKLDREWRAIKPSTDGIARNITHRCSVSAGQHRVSKMGMQSNAYARHPFAADGRGRPEARAAARGDGCAVAGLRRLASKPSCRYRGSVMQITHHGNASEIFQALRSISAG